MFNALPEEELDTDSELDTDDEEELFYYQSHNLPVPQYNPEKAAPASHEQASNNLLSGGPASNAEDQNVLGYIPPMTKQMKKAAKMPGTKMVMDQGKQFALLDWDAAIR